MRFPFRFLPSQKKLLEKLSDIEKKMNTIEKISEIEKKMTGLEKLPDIEKKMIAIEILLKSAMHEKWQHYTPIKPPPSAAPPDEMPSIKIDNINVDKIIIEKLDYANNFGQLGIKELTGKLNIGTSYEGDISKEAAKIFKKKLESKSENGSENEPDSKLKDNPDSKPQNTDESSSKINFRPRKE
ncbi:hypothetical protein [Neobacillus terrae]|uniref:hypothetical protein n=1 Tax=Neobacillus terrae TaxID=3034837 RepID=UPI001408F851|nr:hypothetical protein [Neobacillus terrae]NHM29341.1 hypothetical protein [Neobacillus terrae]